MMLRSVVLRKFSKSIPIAATTLMANRGMGKRDHEQEREREFYLSRLCQTIYEGMLFTSLATACSRALNDDRVMRERF